MFMSHKKVFGGRIIIVGGLLASIGLNLYMFQSMDRKEELIAVEKEKISKKEEALDVFVSQVMNKSAEYASHEDMMLAFGYDSLQKPIHYNAETYYFDLRDVSSHAFDEDKGVKYQIKADMTILKDKVVKDSSYIQNHLPIEVMDKTLKVAKGINVQIEEEHEELPPGHEGESPEEHASHSNEANHSHSHDGHDSHVNIPYVDTIQFEKEAKESLVVHEFEQTISFNMKDHEMIDLTEDAYLNMLREFVSNIVLRGESDYLINIEARDTFYKITATNPTHTKVFSYDKETREMKLVEK